jgi:hypothetical protein
MRSRAIQAGSFPSLKIKPEDETGRASGTVRPFGERIVNRNDRRSIVNGNRE